uniref:Hydroxyproline-rich glycoprotein family protein n=1 Tax=Brassica campestris TaxID=3711 RepID=M4DJK4_BRACM
MAMPPGSVAPGNWIPDGRDGFISWIRGEFAAANAIIDSLCQHLVAIGDQNEYEGVVSAIQHRQSSWSPVLYMQHFFPIADVSYALEQAAWKRQQKTMMPPRHYNSDQIGKFGGRRSGNGFNKHHNHGGGGGYRGGETMVRNGLDCHKTEAKAVAVVEEKRDGSEKLKSDGKDKEESESTGAETLAEVVKHSCYSASKDSNLSSEQKQDEKDKECPASMAKTFVVQEMYEAKMVNVVEGLKLYDSMVDAKEVSQLISLANNLRNAGRRGQLQSDAFVGYKRPNRGHGREMIQLGLPIADARPDDESIKGKFLKTILIFIVSVDWYRRIEPIPSFLSDIIERLVSNQIIPVKPDACIIDFFNEGDHSQPHMFPPWFGRPVGILSLSECDLTFGRVIVSDQPGDYKGSLKLSLSPGLVLVVEGKSADLAKFAIHSIRKQRILITFTKSQPGNGLNCCPPPLSRSPNHHHNRQPKHYPVVIPTTTGVLPTPSVQPVFIAPSPPLPPPMPFPGGVGVMPGATSWPLLPHTRHQAPPQPRAPVPGTGVFLPPGSAQEQVFQGSSNGNNSAEGKVEMKTKEGACNGNAADECGGSGGDGKQVN